MVVTRVSSSFPSSFTLGGPDCRARMQLLTLAIAAIWFIANWFSSSKDGRAQAMTVRNPLAWLFVGVALLLLFNDSIPYRTMLLIIGFLYVGLTAVGDVITHAQTLGDAAMSNVESFQNMSLAERMFAVTGVKTFNERRERFTNRINDIKHDIMKLKTLYKTYERTGGVGADDTSKVLDDDDDE